MATIDLDEARRQRAEAAGEEHELVFMGQKFVLPAELPWACVVSDVEGNEVAAIQALLGEEQFKTFTALDPTQTDVTTLKVESVKLYTGLSLGESEPSRVSSSKGSKRSKATSKGSST